MAKHNETNITAEPGKQEIIIEREFDASQEKLFDVLTNPDLIPHWWGPRRLSTEVDLMEAKDGGRWRFINRDEKGNEFSFHGVYHEISKPIRIIDTFEFDGIPEKGHVSLETLTLEELPGGRTKLKVITVFQSVIDRDMTIQSGMEEGLKETYDRLDEVLEEN